jgi:hypothetical protein
LLFAIVNPRSSEVAPAASRRMRLPRRGVPPVREAGESAAATCPSE